MTSFPNVCNVLTDRAASGSRSALSKGPTFLSMSRAEGCPTTRNYEDIFKIMLWINNQ